MRLGAVGVLAAVVLLAVGALLGGWRPFDTSVEVRTFGPDADLARFALFDGQCGKGDLGGDRGFGPDDDTPCGEPHDIEVVATTIPLNEGRPVAYPDSGELDDFARSYCRMIVHSDLVAPTVKGVDKDDLDVTAVVPGEAAFTAPQTGDASTSGARSVACVVHRGDGAKLTDRFSVI